VASI
jgi:hypothetical protein